MKMVTVTTTARPKTMGPLHDFAKGGNMIPNEMKKIPNWVVTGHKVPYDPKTVYKHREVYSHFDPSTWGTYEDASEALKRHKELGLNIFDHIGFALGGDNNDIICIDIDRGINDDGSPNKFALEIIKKFNSYTEWSVHKRGFHIFVRGHIPANKYHTYNYGIEICARGWTYTMTEEPFLDVELNMNQEAIDWLLEKYFDKEKDIEEIKENRPEYSQV